MASPCCQSATILRQAVAKYYDNEKSGATIWLRVLKQIIAEFDARLCSTCCGRLRNLRHGSLSLTDRSSELAQTAHYSRPIFGYRCNLSDIDRYRFADRRTRTRYVVAACWQGCVRKGRDADAICATRLAPSSTKKRGPDDASKVPGNVPNSAYAEVCGVAFGGMRVSELPPCCGRISITANGCRTT